MAKYKRQKVKHYHRSFYSREMRVKRGIGIAVLVVAVLLLGVNLQDHGMAGKAVDGQRQHTDIGGLHL